MERFIKTTIIIILVLTLTSCKTNENCVDVTERTVIDWEIDEEIILLKLDDETIVKPVSENCFIKVDEND